MTTTLCLVIPSFARMREGGARLPFTTSKQRFIFVNVRAEGRDAVFILDTGATRTFVDVQALKLDVKPGFVVPVQQTNQKTERGVYRLQLEIGDVKVSGQFIEIDLTGTRRDCACEAAGLIGMDVLSRYASVEINFRDGVIWLRP